MTNNLEHFIIESKKLIDGHFQSMFEPVIPEDLGISMRYSLLAGGKRLRPVLLFAGYEAFADTSKDKTVNTALALEMIHTYSLIHDDLPAMDNDDFRRGAPTNHKKFGEATAILAGDALLTYSFQLISEDKTLTADEKIFLIHSLSKASGPSGMVAGQILDMEGEDKELTLEELEKIHQHKTGELITFAVIAGAYLADASKEQLNHLQKFAHYLGLIFQVQDDILDVVGDAEKLGKPVGSDEENDKSTYPGLLGLEGAIKQRELYAEKASKALAAAGAETSRLAGLLKYFSQRDH